MSETSPKRGRGRPRREGADEEILGVVRSMLAERGYRDLTVDGVAEAASVAKTTVYRRWPSKGALVAAAIAPPPAAGSDAATILRDTEERLAFLAGAEDDAEILGVIRAILQPRLELLRALDPRAEELIGAVFVRVFIGLPPH